MFTDIMSARKILENIVIVAGGSTAFLLAGVWGVMCPCMFEMFVNPRLDDEAAGEVMS
jgi:hypothetical protein